MAGDEAELARLRELLAGGGSDVSALLAEARALAEAEVRELLVRAHREALLERVEAELEGETPRPRRGERPRRTAVPPEPVAETSAAPPRAAPAEPAAEPGELGWYVYCVTHESDAGGLPDAPVGIDPRHAVSTLGHDGVAAVVSQVPLAEFGEAPLREHLSDLAWLEQTARAHEAVLESVALGATAVPMRLCSIYRDEQGVRAMLTREGDALRNALSHLDGKQEWGLKAFADPDAPAPDPEPDRAPDGQGAAYMQSRLAQRQAREQSDRRIHEACEAIHAALAQLSAECVTSAPQRPEVSGRDQPMVLNASYLVPAGDTERFHAEVRRLQAEHAAGGLELELTGPWPAYNFVPGTIGAAW